MMNDRIGYIRVTNNTDLPKPIYGRYAGHDYVFKRGEPVDLPEVAAAHIFDFGKDDKSNALMRLGWMRSSEDYEMALDQLGKVSFEDPPEMIEAPRGTKKAKRIGTAGPPVNAVGTEGVGYNPAPNGPKIGTESEGDDDKF